MSVKPAISARLTRRQMSQHTVRRFTARAAAPAGGARCLKWWRVVRGCFFITALAVSPLLADSAAVPSGQSVTLTEVLQDTVGSESWLRFRFMAPQIGRDAGGLSYAEAADDFAHLCDRVARPYLAEFDLAPDVVVISLMDRPVAFGTANPDATQFFEAFRITPGACAPDGF